MFRKLKTYLLISLCLILCACSRSCDLFWLRLFDQDAYIYFLEYLGYEGTDPLSFETFDVAADIVDYVDIIVPYPGEVTDAELAFGPPNAKPRASKNSKSPMYAISTSKNAVYVIDSNRDTQITIIPVGAGPTHGVISRDNTSIYVANTQGDSISVINIATN